MTGPLVENEKPINSIGFRNPHDNREEDIRKHPHNPAAHNLPVTNGNIPDTSNLDPNGQVEEVASSRSSSVRRSLKAKFLSFFRPEFSAENEDAIVEAKKVDHSVQTVGSRPSLTRPKEMSIENDKLKEALRKIVDDKKVKEVVGEDESVSTESSNSNPFSFHVDGESELEQSMYNSLKEGVLIRNKANVNLKDGIIQKNDDQNRLFQDYLNLKAEAEKKAKVSKIFSWVGIGTAVVGTAVLIGGIVAAALATGGIAIAAAIPVALAVAGGLSGVAGGSSAITASVLKYMGNKDAGKSFAAKENGKLIKDDISGKIKDLEDNNSKLMQLWSNLAMLMRRDPKDIFRPS